VTTRRDLITIAVTAGTVIGAGLWVRSLRSPPAPAATAGPPPLPHGTRLDPPRALPAIDLVDETGAAAGPAWLTGRWRLLFFGFTTCPEFCPLTLASLADARQRLAGLPAAVQPDVVLVTVDPGTDDPARLTAYLAGFGPGFHGLTGDPSALAALYTALGVATRRVEMGDGSYMFDHGTAVYVIDPAGQWVALLPAPHAAATVAGAYRALVAPGG
jgi:protein SCO1/2